MHDLTCLSERKTKSVNKGKYKEKKGKRAQYTCYILYYVYIHTHTHTYARSQNVFLQCEFFEGTRQKKTDKMCDTKFLCRRFIKASLESALQCAT